MAARLAPLQIPSTARWSFHCKLNYRVPASSVLKHAINRFYYPRHPLRRANWPASRQAKHASNLASSTAIGVTRNVPESLEKLHSSLVKVQNDAAPYINVSKLGLALRSLETRDPVTRLAILGIGEQNNARRLARVLLADPLTPKEQWEDDLDYGRTGDEHSLLLRYGTSDAGSTKNALANTLSVPSSRLKDYNLEILVGTLDEGVLNTQDAPAPGDLDDVLLAPSLQVSAPPDGRLLTMIHPVHKAILYGTGIRGCVTVGRLMAGQPLAEPSKSMVKVVMGLPAHHDQSNADDEAQMVTVDVDLASSALNEFRASIENATAYEHDWFQSGMPALTSWFAQGLRADNQPIKPVLRHMIRSLLDEVEVRMQKEAVAKSRALAAATVPEDRRRAMRKSLSLWAEEAHTELRDELEAAFNGREWHRLKWWKLLWRIDDVDSIASAILQRKWLVQAERRIIWLAGRLEGAGFFDYKQEPNPVTVPVDAGQRLSSLAGIISAPPSSAAIDSQAGMVDEGVSDRPPRGPWPTDISLARHALSMATVPVLQAFGQSLIIRSLTTTAMSFALSALLYVSYPGLSVYEVGAIASIGTVWSVKTLQRRWEGARQHWRSEVQEEGRKALKETESVIAKLIEDGGRPSEREEDVAARDAARESVALARKALQQLR